MIYFIYFPFALATTYIVSRIIKSEYEYRKSIDYPYNNTDIKWDAPMIFVKFPLYSFLSGLMAGLLGIGGGLILGPLLLELGLHPVVSTATSNFLVLFTSSSTSIQFILLVILINLGDDEFRLRNCLHNSVNTWIIFWNPSNSKTFRKNWKEFLHNICSSRCSRNFNNPNTDTYTISIN